MISFSVLSCEASNDNFIYVQDITRVSNKNTELLMAYIWYTDKYDVLCFATIEDEKPLEKKLEFYNKKNSRLEKIYEYIGIDTIMYSEPLGKDNLLTVWETATALRVRIFSLLNGKITVSFEAGTKVSPEIIDIDNDGIAEILISNGSFSYDSITNKIISYPDKVNVYKCDGHKIYLWRTVSWKNRFSYK